ncbi:MAG: hypothetical protein KIH63_005050 [Candidatus Saccharibacteria bacterium]|nr:hypothetical protein [Candidatus Saccharibacteria bacterium]
MFGTNSNDNTAQTDQGQTTAPAFDVASTDQVAMTSEAPSYLPSVPGTNDDAAAPADEAAALDSLVSAHDEPADTPATDTPVAPTPAPAADDLLMLKQQALQQLTPLVGHLEQSAEDRFRTFMMMIQASDDKSLINSAYEAAQEIEDEKVRAQALLDVVNEINYFTQKDQPTNQD